MISRRNVLLSGLLAPVAWIWTKRTEVGDPKPPQETATWIVWGPEEGVYEEFDTEERAVEVANDLALEYCASGEWTEGVEQIIVAKLTHICVQTNVVTKDMLVDGEYRGRYYSGEYDSWCDYEMERV